MKDENEMKDKIGKKRQNKVFLLKVFAHENVNY